MYQGEQLHMGGGGGTSFYKPYRYVPPHRVGFLRCFGLKIRLGFRGNFGSVWTSLLFQFQMSKKFQIRNEFE